MLNLGAQYYIHIYYGLVTILSLIVFLSYTHYSNSRLGSNYNQSPFGVIVLALLLASFIGQRPVSAMFFVDMASYDLEYSTISGDVFYFDWDATNLLFDNYLSFLASHNIPVGYFFLSIAAVYFIGIAWSCSSLFPKDKLVSFLVYLGAFSTFAYGTNGIKAGAAASLFLIALALREKRKWVWCILFLLLSIGFHHSMILPIAAFLVCSVIKNPKWFYAFWVFCFFMALFNVTYFQELFAGFTDEQGALYLSGEGEYVRHDILGGFRIDFILYSAAPMIIGWIAVFKKKITSRNYIFLLNLYTLTNAIWLLCMYAEFTNRIAYLSWLMLPIVLIYPLLNENYGKKQYAVFQWVAFGHLAFTLFMNYIYY